ncbi:MAG: YciI family protein [Nitrospira sp.]|nr:YciI family protein [Nitrospira sp.]
MTFVIIGYDGPEGATKRPIYRSAHLANLERLNQEGRVLLAGPMTDNAGSLMVLQFESWEEAELFARTDPYTVHGVFERVEVHPFLPVFPKPV